MVLSTGKSFYFISGFYSQYDNEKCKGFDSLLSSNPLLVSAVLLYMGTEKLMKTLGESIPDCNGEEQLYIVPFWRDCYSIATYKDTTSGVIQQILLSCGGESQCCAVYSKCYDHQENRCITNFVINYPSTNIYCPDTPMTVPNLSNSILVKISKCEKMSDIMDQLMKG